MSYVRQVADVRLGIYRVELDETRLGRLNEVCERSEDIVKDLTEANDWLLEVADHLPDLESEIFTVIKLLFEVRKDYGKLKEIDIRKEVSNG